MNMINSDDGVEFMSIAAQDCFNCAESSNTLMSDLLAPTGCPNEGAYAEVNEAHAAGDRLRYVRACRLGLMHSLVVVSS